MHKKDQILFVKMGAIGDVIQAAAALLRYREVVSDSALHWVADIGVAPLVEAMGVADRVIAIDEASLVSDRLLRRTKGLLWAMAALRTRGAWRYDQIYTAYSDPRSRILTLGIPCRLHRTLGERGGKRGYIVHRQRVHEYWRLLTLQDEGCIDVAAMLASLGARLRSRLGEIQVPISGAGYVAVAAGGAKNTWGDEGLRRWPVERFRRLIELLLARGHRVALVGGQSDAWVSQAMQGLPVEDLIGRTTLPQLLCVLQGARTIVSNDSGIFHLATLTTTGLVGLFGPTPANAVAPFGRPGTRILASDNRVSCSPCYDGRYYAPCARNVCLESISVESVAEAVESLG